MPLGTEVGLRPGHTVLDGDPASPKKGHSSPPNFRPKSTVAKWLDGSRIKMPLGTEVGFGPGDIVLDIGLLLTSSFLLEYLYEYLSEYLSTC